MSKDKKPLAILLGEHLLRLREQNNKFRNRSFFAREIGEDPQKISNYEFGYNFPSIEILVKLHNTLHRSFEELLAPLLEMKKTDLETEAMLNKVSYLLTIPEYRRAIKTMLDSIVLPEEKTKARGSPRPG